MVTPSAREENMEFYITVGPATSTADILTYLLTVLAVKTQPVSNNVGYILA